MDSQKRGRVSPTDEQKIELGKFFDHCCVVTGNIGAFVWHHLDDDESNGSTENFLPLAADLNIYLRDKKRETTKGKVAMSRADLIPMNLGKSADLLATIQWKYGRAYGCARLGAYISTNYLREDPSVALSLAAQAIYFARHQLCPEKIIDTFRRSILPLLETGQLVAPSARYAIIREVAGIYAEHGRNKAAIELFASLRSFKSESSNNPSPVLRREATAMGARFGLNQKVLALFDEAGRWNPGSRSHAVSVANSLSWMHICDERYDEALDVLEPIVECLHKEIFRPGKHPVAIEISPWNAAEPFHNYAIAVSQVRPRDYKTKVTWATNAAASLFKIAGAGLYLIRKDDSAKHQAMLDLPEQYWKPRNLSRHLVNAMNATISSLALIPR